MQSTSQTTPQNGGRAKFFLARVTGTCQAGQRRPERFWLRRLATALAINAGTTYTGPAAWIDVNALRRPGRAIARSDELTCSVIDLRAMYATVLRKC